MSGVSFLSSTGGSPVEHATFESVAEAIERARKVEQGLACVALRTATGEVLHLYFRAQDGGLARVEVKPAVAAEPDALRGWPPGSEMTRSGAVRVPISDATKCWSPSFFAYYTNGASAYFRPETIWVRMTRGKVEWTRPEQLPAQLPAQLLEEKP